MNANDVIKTRRSVRKYKDEVVSREVLEEIMELTRYTPSWANAQVARFTFVNNKDIIAQIANDGVKGFVYNMKTLQNAKGVLVLSHVVGKSGKLPAEYNVEEGPNSHVWEHFDSGIACQTFCLAAWEKGVGTCVFGVIDEKSIAQILDLPQDETVSAVIVYGYPDEEPKTPARKEISELARFID